MERSLLRGLAILALVVAAGCGTGGDAAGDDDDDGGSGSSVDEPTASSAGGSLANSAEYGARAYGVGGGAAAAFACDVVTSGGDSDGDGVPDYAAIQHADCSKMTPWGLGVVNGDEVITDNQPMSPGVDYSLAQDLDIALSASGENVSFENVNVATQEGSAFLLDQATVTLHTGSDFSNEEEIAWVMEYSPSSAWAPGDPMVAGTLVVDGAYVITLEQAGTTTILQAAVATEVPLSIDPGCPTLIVGGTIHAVVGDGTNAQILEVSWSGCDASGTELLPAP